MKYALVETPIGTLTLVVGPKGLQRLSMHTLDLPDASERHDGLEAAVQVQQYFKGERTAFDVALDPQGTPFQKSVWQALLEIPFGQTRTYGQIATRIGRPTASRAVGAANGRNPIAIIVPCHRVIGTNGTLTGYAGGLDRKRTLLDLEQPQLGF